jgi:hypothetical protein
MGQTATLTGLGPNFTANALSRNGKVAVGLDKTMNAAAYWSNGAVSDISGPSTGSVLNSCNSDASIIVGTDNGVPFVEFIESNDSAVFFSSLPLLSGNANGTATLINAGGTTIAGYSGGTPVIWEMSEFPTGDVTTIGGTTAQTIMNSISDDGSTIACDLTGTYGSARNGFPGGFGAQSPGVVLGTPFGPVTNVATPYYHNLYNPDNDLTAYEDLFCLTSDGTTQFGAAFDAFTVTEFPPIGSDGAPVYDNETDGFITVSNTSTTGAPLGNFSNFEPHSCSSDGSILGGGAVTPAFGTDIYGNLEAISIVVGNPEIAFGGKVLDLNQFITGKGAATAGWTLTNVSTQAMSGDGSVILGKGTLNNVTQNFIVTISPALTSLKPGQNTFVGGSSVQSTVGLDFPAPAGTTVDIESDNLGVIPAQSVPVSKGTMLGAFTLSSVAVTAPTTVTITATLNSTTVTAKVTVNPPLILITEFYPAAGTVVGGNTILGYVRISPTAGASGDVIKLSSNNAGVQVPASVKVATGTTVGSFSITSNPVKAVTTATITATIGTSAEYTVVTVIPPTVSLVKVAPSPVVGGVSTKVAVYLNGKAPAGGFPVTVASNNTSVVVPATITVLAGATAANATVTTKVVSSSTTVVVTAKTGAASTETTMVLNPAVVYPAITQFSPSAGVIVGGNAATATVTLASAAGTGGDVVHLSSSTSGVTVPATVTVLAGKTSVSFSLTSTPVMAVTTATLTATLGTAIEKAAVTIVPPSVSLVRVSPSPVVGGVSTKVAVYLNGKAPVGGLTVTLASNNPSAHVPATITVPAGATAANATVTTSAVTAATAVVVTAKTGSVTTLTTMLIDP